MMKYACQNINEKQIVSNTAKSSFTNYCNAISNYLA